MTAETVDTKIDTPFESQLKAHYMAAQQNKPNDLEALDKLRAKSWERFQEMGLPTRKDEAFNYVRMNALTTLTFQRANSTEIDIKHIQAAVYPECRHSYLVYVNGCFQPQLSNCDALPKQLVVLKLKDAMRTYGALLNNHWTKSLKEEKDAFALLNGALHADGLFIYLPPKVAVTAPLQIINVIDTAENAMLLTPRLHVFVGAHAVLSILSSQVFLSGKNYAINGLADFAIEEGAHIQYTQIICDEADNIWHFDATRASLKRHSSFKTVCITDGSASVRTDYRIALMGENAEAYLNGMGMLSHKNEAHTHILMEHHAPYCRSYQLFKNIVSDTAKASFEGKIYVHQIAQKTEAFQLNNNLILNEYAFAYSKPNLEIFADDVKASHGSTVGQLDTEQLFYLKTRGFQEMDAKNLLIYGFCKEVVDKLPIPSLVDAISQRAKRFSHTAESN